MPCRQVAGDPVPISPLGGTPPDSSFGVTADLFPRRFPNGY